MATFFEFSGCQQQLLGKDIFLKKNTITPKAQDNKHDILSMHEYLRIPYTRVCDEIWPVKNP